MEKVTRRNFIVTTTAVAAGACLCGLEGCIVFSLHAEFSLDGKVIGDGPTSKALTLYPIRRQDDNLLVRFV